MNEPLYREPPRCLHRELDDDGRCKECGAVLLWVVEKPIDYEAAAAHESASILEYEDMMAIVDAALGIGGDDE